MKDLVEEITKGIKKYVLEGTSKELGLGDLVEKMCLMTICKSYEIINATASDSQSQEEIQQNISERYEKILAPLREGLNQYHK